MMSAVRDTLEWEAADEIIYLRHDVDRLKKICKEVRTVIFKIPRPWMDGGITYKEWDRAWLKVEAFLDEVERM